MGKGGGGSSFPNSRSDIEQLIRMQEDAANRAAARTARYNFFDIFTPFGNRRFEGTPGSDDFRQIQELPEAERQYLEQQRQMRLGLQGIGQQQMGQLRDIFGQPLDVGTGEEVERATFGRGLNLLQPTLDRQSERLENQLVARGIPRSSQAYAQEQQDLSRSQGSALENLALSSVQAGRQEQSRALQSELARRSGMLNEFGALTGNQVQSPAFQATPSIGVGAADVMGPVGMANQNAALDQQAKAAGKGGLTQLGGSALMAAGMGGFGGGGKGAGKGGATQVGSSFSPFGYGYG